MFSACRSACRRCKQFVSKQMEVSKSIETRDAKSSEVPLSISCGEAVFALVRFGFDLHSCGVHSGPTTLLHRNDNINRRQMFEDTLQTPPCKAGLPARLSFCGSLLRPPFQPFHGPTGCSPWFLQIAHGQVTRSERIMSLMWLDWSFRARSRSFLLNAWITVVLCW